MMRMQAETEKQFAQAVLTLARLCGYLCYHTHDSRHSESGFPDLIFVHAVKRDILAAELKMPGKHPTPAQQTWLEALQACGVETYCWYPDDFPQIQQRLQRRPPREG